MGKVINRPQEYTGSVVEKEDPQPPKLAFHLAQTTQVMMSLLLYHAVNLGPSAGLMAVVGCHRLLQPALLHWLGGIFEVYVCGYSSPVGRPVRESMFRRLIMRLLPIASCRVNVAALTTRVVLSVLTDEEGEVQACL